MKILIELFVDFFRISLLVIGGGYAIISVADDHFARKGWIKEGELLDNLPLFQMIPGLIATHTAVYVGSKNAGWLGAFISVVAVALPAVGIFSLVAMGYKSLPLDNPYLASAFVGLRAALTGVIAAAIIRSWKRNLNSPFAYSVMLLSVASIALGHFNVALVLVGAALLGIAYQRCHGRFGVQLWPLLVFLKYGSLCFGGGFVIVPMYMEDFVGAAAPYLQVSTEEFSNVIALSQMTPGPIGVNAVTFFGFRLFADYGRMAGLAGALVASLLLLLPGSFMVYAALKSLERFHSSRIVTGILSGVRPAAVALMLIAFWAFFAMSAFSADGSVNLIAIALTVVALIVVMKKKLNVMAVIWLSAFAALALRADEITVDRFSDADTVVIEESERTRYNPDGTYECTQESWTKLLTERGRRSESSISLDYSRRYGEGRIAYVGVVGADGKEREIDVSNTTKDATDNSSMSVNIYDPLDRVITCTVPGLKIGDVLHVKLVRKTNKPRCEGKWADLSTLEGTEPVLKSTYEVTAPKELPLRKIAIRHPLGNIVTNLVANADGSLTYTFVATNSPQAFPEPDMPPMYTQVQHVRVSTATDWPEISRWYWELSVPHLVKTNAAMKAKLDELLAHDSKLSRDDKIRRIYRFVSQEVRYMGLTMEDTSPGYAPHDVDITFGNRYGVCRDKAGLLVAMLRMAGFDAFPVLIQVGAKLDKEVPQPFFNHAIVAVENLLLDRPSRGKYQLMDPTDENAKEVFPTYLSDKSYLVCRAEGEDLMVSPVPSPERNELTVDSRGTLARDGSLFLENTLRMNGINDTAYRHTLVKMTPEDRIKLFERLLRRVQPGAELVRCEIEPSDMRDTERPIEIRLASNFPEMVLKGETRDELTVPFISRVFGVANFLLAGNTSLESRKYPLVLDTTARVIESVKINLGGALGRPQSMPPDEKFEGGYVYSRTMLAKDDMLIARREQSLGSMEFDPAAYANLREQIKCVEAIERRRPVFAKNVLQDADVRVIFESTETDVLSDHSWVTTNRMVKEVLTYAGKKGSAELTFNFNPTWKSVELLYATVSNRNGQVAKVSPREVNVMDAAWTASAPRYPAGKIKVVNLPSVEIGSVISYAWVVSVTNSSVGFYSSYGFDSHAPLDHKIVRVNDWRREVISPRRIPDEPSQPEARLWRDVVVVASNRFESLSALVTPAPLELEEFSGKSPREIRDWMARYVKVVGPSLYDLPLVCQLTQPETVVKERYATRLDYVRTLCALLRGAGYEAELVLAASDAGYSAERRERIMHLEPNVRAFSLPLCRLKLREGGFLGLGATERVIFLGTENQYAEFGASAYDGCDYYDPATGEFGVVSVPEAQLADFKCEMSQYLIRADGAVDLDVTNIVAGSEVAAFRKTYSEILPEMRQRRYQAILGGVAQAATATSELVTDTEGYPASRNFSCYIPDYAVVSEDAITLTIPPLVSSIPAFTGRQRETPFALAACDEEAECVTIHFPEGYTKIEHLPKAFTFADPLHPEVPWLEYRVTSDVLDGVLSVVLKRQVHRHHSAAFGPNYLELINDWNRIANSRANRTIVVRREVTAPQE